MRNKGLLVVISAPSGGGKTTVIRRVLASGNENFRYSISATTRPKRKNEIAGKDYFFLSRDEFWRKQKKGEFVEWAEVHGEYYATPKGALEKWIAEGSLVFLDLDVDGGIEIKKQFGESSRLIFIRPSSLESLEQRLRGRNTESQAEIEKRLQRYPKEIKKSEFYDYQIVNENLDNTVEAIFKILNGHNSLVRQMES